MRQIPPAVMGMYLVDIRESPAETTNVRMTKLVLTFSRSPFVHKSPKKNNNVYNFIGSNETINVSDHWLISRAVTIWIMPTILHGLI